MRITPFILAVSSVLGCNKVPAGYVGVKVYLLGTAKGVDHEVLPVGRYWIGVNEELYLFPTFQQNYVWTKSLNEGNPTDESLTFQTREGLTANTDVGITYSLESDKIGTIFQKYRRGVVEITDVFLRNHVRDAFNAVSSEMTVEDIYGQGKIRLLDEVQKQVAAEVGPIGIKVEKIYLVGDMRLPQNVVAALNSKIEATQRAQQRENELREAEAQAKKEIAAAEGESGKAQKIAEGRAIATLTEAKAQAEANRIISASLTKELIDYRKVDKWDGKLPQFSAGSASPLINLAPSP